MTRHDTELHLLCSCTTSKVQMLQNPTSGRVNCSVSGLLEPDGSSGVHGAAFLNASAAPLREQGSRSAPCPPGFHAQEESGDMARVEGPTKIRADDPQTLVGLIWRVIGDPARVVMLIVLLAALAGALSLLLTVIAPVWVHVSVAGGASFGVLLVSFLLRRVRRGR